MMDIDAIDKLTAAVSAFDLAPLGAFVSLAASGPRSWSE